MEITSLVDVLCQVWSSNETNLFTYVGTIQPTNGSASSFPNVTFRGKTGTTSTMRGTNGGVPGTGVTFQFTAQPNTMYTISTVESAMKGEHPVPPQPHEIPLPYVEDFNGYPGNDTIARYWSDQGGSWSVAVRVPAYECVPGIPTRGKPALLLALVKNTILFEPVPFKSILFY